ncbi:MAG: hypothetical protein L7U87_04815 [Chlamydiales bacterium]|nr:hypothetical protein [Chlamydiales bacterium]
MHREIWSARLCITNYSLKFFIDAFRGARAQAASHTHTLGPCNKNAKKKKLRDGKFTIQPVGAGTISRMDPATGKLVPIQNTEAKKAEKPSIGVSSKDRIVRIQPLGPGTISRMDPATGKLIPVEVSK